VLFGARALVEIDARWAAHVLAAWDEDRLSLVAAATIREAMA
jgi:hypothetical protein